jgi:hypothetical protein
LEKMTVAISAPALMAVIHPAQPNFIEISDITHAGMNAITDSTGDITRIKPSPHNVSYKLL